MSESQKKRVKKVSSVEEYRQNVGKIVEIDVPSGMTFKVKRITPMDLIRGGLADIPNEFFTFLAHLQAGNLNEISGEVNGEKHKSNYDLFEKFINVIISQGIVEPPVTYKYDKEKENTHLLYNELDALDQKFLVDVITGRLKVD